MKSWKKLLVFVLAFAMIFGTFPLGALAAEDGPRSLDEREIEDYLKPDPSPMDAAPDLITLEAGKAQAQDVQTTISLDGTWNMAQGGTEGQRLGTVQAAADSQMQAANKAFDGAWATEEDAWISLGETAEHWVSIDLAVAQRANKFVVKHFPGTQMTQDFVIQGSEDGQSWVDIKTVTGNTQEESLIELEEPVEYRYYRLYIKQANLAGDNIARIREFQIYLNETVETDYALNKEVTTNSSPLAGMPASNITNGDWSSQSTGCWVGDWTLKTDSDPNIWAIIDLGQARTFYTLQVYNVGMDGETGDTSPYNTKAYKVEGSLDGESWDLLGEETDNSGPSTEYSFPEGVTYQYIRFTIIEPCDPSVGTFYRVYEIRALAEEEKETLLSLVPEEGPWVDAMPAVVPGSVHTALLQNDALLDDQGNVVKDPYFAIEDKWAREASYKDYWFETTFNLSQEDIEAGNIRLNFHGVCESGTFYLNGQEIGTHVGMFGGPYLDISDVAVAGENQLIVHLNGAPNRKRTGPGELPTFFGGGNPWLNLGWIDTVVFNNVYGWHYADIPALGIWESVEVDVLPEVEVVDPFISTVDTATGTMDFYTELNNADGNAIKGTLQATIEPKNFVGESYSFSYPVDTTDSHTSVRLRFDIPDPQLWWLNNLGDQNLYNLKLYFVDEAGNTLDFDQEQFGIRTVEMAPVEGIGPDEDTYNWTFIVNGKKTFIKGTGWCTIDAFMRFSRENYDKYLYAAKQQNIQMLRAWGSGMVETDTFYDLCDEYGIAVMQEWPTAWDSYVYQPEEALLETVEVGVKRLRNRASLFMWCGGNEGAAYLDQQDVEDKYTGPYPEAFDPTVLNKMGKLTIELDGTRPWHRQDPYGGSRHDYSASWSGMNPQTNMTLETIFWGEFGVDCWPNMESIEKFTPQAELDALKATEGTDEWEISPDGALAYHTPMFNTSGDLARQQQHVDLYLPENSLENSVMGSQIAQAIGLRYTLERARTRWPEATGALMYKLNDPYPAASWSTVDWYGSPKYAHYVVQDAYAPLAAIGRFDTLNHYASAFSVPLYLVDDADELAGKEWTVEARAYNSAGIMVKSEKIEGQGSIDQVELVGELSLTAKEADTMPLFIITDILVDGKLVHRNDYYMNFEEKQGSLFEMPKTTLSWKVEGNAFTVTNTGKNPAVNVHFDCAEVSDTFRPDDNWFWLEPGESKTITANFTEGVKGFTSWNMAQEDATAPSAPANAEAKDVKDQSVTLVWDASEDEESGVQGYFVYRDGQRIAFVQDGTQYVDADVQEDTSYNYVITALNNGALESANSNTVSVQTYTDIFAPEMTNVETNYTDTVTITFNEKLDQATAENTANYKITPDAKVESAKLGESGDVVTLTVSQLSKRTEYTLAISGVEDASQAGNVIEQATTSFSALAASWSFDEGEGTTFKEDKGKAEDGTLTAPVSWTTGATGKDGDSALFFNGDDEQLASLPNFDVNVGDEFTISVKVKADEGRDNLRIILAKGPKDTGHFELFIDNAGRINFYAPDLGLVVGQETIDDSQWHHVAVTMKDHTLSIYVDGVLTGSGYWANRITDETETLAFGRLVVMDGGTLFPYMGAIDDARIYYAALTPEEIQEECDEILIPMTGLALNRTTLQLGVDDVYKLRAIFHPANTTDDKTLTWETSDAAIATVDSQGQMEGIAPGTATITATTADGKFTASCQVIVAQGEVPDTRLLSHWKFDEEAGAATAKNEVLGAGDFVIPQDSTSGFQEVEGHKGLSLVGDAQGRLQIEDFSVNIGNAFTIGGYVQLSPEMADQNAVLFSKGPKDGGHYEIWFNEGKLAFYTVDITAPSPARTLYISEADLSDGKLHHIAVSYDGDVFSYYLDGEHESSLRMVGSIADETETLYLGALDDGTMPFTGFVDDLRIYEEALSNAEIAQWAGYEEEEPEPGPDRTSKPQKYTGEVTSLNGLDRLVYPQLLPIVNMGATTGYEGSIDKTGGNADWDWNLYRDENGEYVLFEADGPGCIYNFTQHRYPTSKEPTFNFYFDGASEPQFSIKLSEFGTKAPFLSPLSDIYEGPEADGAGPIWVVRSFAPMLFSEHVKITSTVKLEGNDKAQGQGGWGHVTYELFDSAEGIETYTGGEDYSQLLSLIKDTGFDPKYAEENTAKTGEDVVIPAGETVTIYDEKGEGAISSFKLAFAKYGYEMLHDLHVRIYWDGHEKADVDAPLGTFFGNEYGLNDVNNETIMLGNDIRVGKTSSLYNYYPMPYWESARIELYNTGERDITLDSFEIQFTPSSVLAYPREETGYFTSSEYYPRTANEAGENSVIAEIEGTGHMVYGTVSGTNLTLSGCEGDVRIFVDGKESPIIESDGSESWASYGWGFATPPQCNPYSMYDGESDAYNPNWSMTRLTVGDSYHFKSSLRFELEHGNYNDGGGMHSGQIFYYALEDGPKVALTDTVDVGDAASEEAHAYTVDGTSKEVSLTSAYANGYNQDNFQDSGRANISGSSSFTVAIDPDNQGVTLQRLSDQQKGRQCANIYVDGKLVSERQWLYADYNGSYRWLDDDFQIPASYTAGKSSITITVEPVDVGGGNTWNEYKYEVYSVMPLDWVNNIPVEKLKISPYSVRVVAGVELDLSVEVTPQNATNQEVKWRSDNPDVADVDQNGHVVTKQVGKARIYAEATDGSGVTCYRTVTVYQPVTKLKISPSSVRMFVGEEIDLDVAVTPGNAYNKDVTWVSEDPTVATVDQDGYVVAKKTGASRIYATAKDGSGVTCYRTVTVYGPLMSGLYMTNETVERNSWERTRVTYDLNYRGLVDIQILDAKGKVVRTLREKLSVGAAKGRYATWNLKDDQGNYVPAGVYTAKVTATLPSGELSTSAAATFTVVNPQKAKVSDYTVTASSRSAMLSYTLNTKAACNFYVYDANGKLVFSKKNVISNPGSSIYVWDYRDSNGKLLPKDASYSVNMYAWNSLGKSPIAYGAIL